MGDDNSRQPSRRLLSSSPSRPLLHSSRASTRMSDSYRQKRDFQRPTVLSRYAIIGFLSSGTYGRVYKGSSHLPPDLPPTS